MRVPEDAAERLQEVRQALGNGEPLAPEDINQELHQLFESFGTALRAGDQNRVMNHFDLERMIEEIPPQVGIPLRTLKEKRDFARGMRQGMGTTLNQNAPLAQGKSFEIRNVKKLNGSEAVAIVRYQLPEGATLKMRWWVTRQAGAWKIYDMEDLEVGLKVSAMVGSLLAQGIGKGSAAGRALSTLGEVIRSLGDGGDVDAADKKLQTVATVQLPGQTEALRHLAQGIIHLHRSQHQEALTAVAKGRACHPDMPVLDFLQGVALNKLGQWDKALKFLEAYRDLLGEDSPTCQALGEALRGVSRFEDAARVYRKGLDLNPKDADCFFGLLSSLEGNDNHDDLEPRFTRLDSPQDNFDIYAADLEERKIGAMLEPLVRAMRKIDPQHAPVDYYLSLSRARAGQTEEAVPLFKAALAKQKDAAKRQEYAKGFLQVMATAGQGAAAYAVVPDAGEAFRFLAADAAKTYRLDQLKQLVAAHGQKHGDDPLLPFYQAEVFAREGQYALADRTFTAALAKPPDQDTLALFRSSRVLARYYTGATLSAYRDIGPRSETFAQLAYLLFQAGTDEELPALLEEHAKHEPKSFDLLRFQSRLKIRQNKVAEGLALFKAALAQRAEDNQRVQAVSEILVDLVQANQPLEGYRAAPDARRAFLTVAWQLLRLGRDEDLRRLVETHRAGQPDDLWLAYYEGRLHLRAMAWDKAAAVLAEGLKKAPEDNRESFRYWLVYALYKAGRYLRANAEVEPHKETFAQLTNLLARDKKGVELGALVTAQRALAGDDPVLLYYEARALALQKKPAEAVACFRKACAQVPAVPQQDSHVYTWLMDMQEAGLLLEGYRAAPDKSSALSWLANRLESAKKDKELAALLEEHGKDHADDPLYRYYQGELFLLRGDAQQAEPHFVAALAKAPPQQQPSYRQGLFRARIKLGQTAATYQEAGRGTAHFEALANLCLQEKDAKQLQTLIAAHRQAMPDDASLPAWDVEVPWLNGDYEGVLKVLQEHPLDTFAWSRFRWKYESYRVRSLVKLKRGQEAIQEAESFAKGPSGNGVLLVLAHTSTGDVKQSIAVMEKLRSRSWVLRGCYQDADLGAILRGEAFRAFREQFPEPKEPEKGEDGDPDGD